MPIFQSPNNKSDYISASTKQPVAAIVIRMKGGLGPDFVTENCDYSTALYHLPSRDYGDEQTWLKFVRNLNSKFDLNFGTLVASLRHCGRQPLAIPTYRIAGINLRQGLCRLCVLYTDLGIADLSDPYAQDDMHVICVKLEQTNC
jgi:hypothetical protein